MQPILWLLVFGQVFAKVKAIPTGGVSYLAFMTPGILAQSVLFSAIFYGIAVIWERDLGIVHKVLVSPASRTRARPGEGAVRGRARPRAGRDHLRRRVRAGRRAAVRTRRRSLGVLAFVMLGSATFPTFSLVIACIVKTRERFMGIGQLLTMPLFFASNAIYPLDLMPAWLQRRRAANPLTYLVDALRTLMVEGGRSVFGLGIDVGVQLTAFVLLLSLAAKLYPTLVR